MMLVVHQPTRVGKGRSHVLMRIHKQAALQRCSLRACSSIGTAAVQEIRLQMQQHISSGGSQARRRAAAWRTDSPPLDTGIA